MSELSIDLEVMGGYPCIKNTRVTTDFIKMFYLAGESEETIARYYNISQEAVLEAVMWEKRFSCSVRLGEWTEEVWPEPKPER